MRIGVVFPQTELAGQPEGVRAFARKAEKLGYSYLLAYDHVLGCVQERDPPMHGPYSERDAFHDPLTMFAHLAACTQTIEFVSGVLVLPQRQTALVARQAADLDILSGERFSLGVGVGWNPVEFEGLGQDFGTRGNRMREQVVLLRKLWSEPVVDFEGAFHRIDRAAINPRPKRSIPIWMGGFAEPVLQRAAELADGFIFAAQAPSADKAPPALARRLEQLFAERGRSFDGFGLKLTVSAAQPSSVVGKIAHWRDRGGTHATVNTLGLGFANVGEHIDHLAGVRDALDTADF